MASQLDRASCTKVCIWTVTSLLSLIQCAPTLSDENSAVPYLPHVVYINQRSDELNADANSTKSYDVTKEPLRDFHKLYERYPDDCKVEDEEKSFVRSYGRMESTDLTYTISQYPSKLPRDVTEGKIKEAFAVWSAVTPLTFTKIDYGPVHIDIKFVTGDHGDSTPFTRNDPSARRANELAHATYPLHSRSQVHFDDSDSWTAPEHEIDLMQVAAHEFGHSLGLWHSKVPGAVMYCKYARFNPNFKLHPDDINRIQALYGSRSHRPNYGGYPGYPMWYGYRPYYGGQAEYPTPAGTNYGSYDGRQAEYPTGVAYPSYD